MSIDQEKVLDIVAVDEKTGEVYLIITDHLSWENEINEHIFKLQEKINSYLASIESGELNELYPLANGKKPVIKVIGKYPIPSNEIVARFYDKATSVVQWAGFDLRFECKP